MSPELPEWASEMAWMSGGDESLPSDIPGINLVLNRVRLAAFLADFAEDKDVRDLLELDVLANAAGLPLTSTGAAEPLPHLAARPFRIWEYTWLYKTLRLSKGGLNVLDLGGPASHLSLLSALAGCRVTSLDINPEFVNAANECARALKLGSFEARIGDMRDLSIFGDRSFDAVMSCSVLEHLQARDQKTALQEMARVLKPGGVIGLTFDFGPGAPGANEHLPPPHDPPGSSAEVRKRYLQDGLTVMGNAVVEEPIPGSLFHHEFIRYTVASLFLTRQPGQGKKPPVMVQAPRPERGKSRLANLGIEKLPYLMFKNLYRPETVDSSAEMAEIQRVAAERLAELDLKEAELNRIRAEGERRTKELERSAVAACQWEAVSSERLAAMHEKENLIAQLNAELKARDATLKQMQGHLERAASNAKDQQRRAETLEAAAAERLEGIQKKEQTLGQLHAELKARNAGLAAMQENVERAAADAKAQQVRAAKLEAAAAERLEGMQKKEQTLKQLHAELKARDRALAAMQEHVERAAANVKAQQERAAKLEATAAERLAEMQEKQQANANLHAELKARDAALAAQQERAVKLETAAVERLEGMRKNEQANAQLQAALEGQRGRAEMFAAAAAERLEAVEAKEQVIAQLLLESKTRDAELSAIRAYGECAAADAKAHRERAAQLEAVVAEHVRTVRRSEEALTDLRAEQQIGSAARSDLCDELDRAASVIEDSRRTVQQQEESIEALRAELNAAAAVLDRQWAALQAEIEAQAQHIRLLEEEGFRDYVVRRFRRKRLTS